MLIYADLCYFMLSFIDFGSIMGRFLLDWRELLHILMDFNTPDAEKQSLGMDFGRIWKRFWELFLKNHTF